MGEQETVGSGEEARAFLATTFSKVYEAALERVEVSNKGLLEDAKKQAEQLIQGLVDIHRSVNKGKLWGDFLEKFYAQPPELVGRLIGKLFTGQKEALLQAESVEDMLSIAQDLLFIGSSGFVSAISIARILPAHVDDLNKVLEAYRGNVDEDMAGFLEGFWGSIRAGSLPLQSFVVLKEVNGKRFVIGVEIEDGQVKNLGIANLRARCRVGVFEDFYDNADLQSQKLQDGCMIIKVQGKLEDYVAKAFMDPYAYPNDLFLLKCGMSERWGALDLIESRVGEDLKKLYAV